MTCRDIGEVPFSKWLAAKVACLPVCLAGPPLPACCVDLKQLLVSDVDRTYSNSRLANPSLYLVVLCPLLGHTLPFTGYGMLGVCLDSVALIQQAMAGRCTIFPLLLGGEAKFSLLALYRQAAAEGWSYAPEARQLAAALAALPCDALQEPATAADAARWAASWFQGLPL